MELPYDNQLLIAEYKLITPLDLTSQQLAAMSWLLIFDKFSQNNYLTDEELIANLPEVWQVKMRDGSSHMYLGFGAGVYSHGVTWPDDGYQELSRAQLIVLSNQNVASDVTPELLRHCYECMVDGNCGEWVTTIAQMLPDILPYMDIHDLVSRAYTGVAIKYGFFKYLP